MSCIFPKETIFPASLLRVSYQHLSTVSDCQPQDFPASIPIQKASLAGTARPVCFGDCATGKLVENEIRVRRWLSQALDIPIYTATVVDSA